MISSAQNPRVKSLLSLHQTKGRKEAGCYLIEGTRFVETAVEAGASLMEIYYVDSFMADDRGRNLISTLTSSGVELVSVTEPVMRALSQTQTPQGIVAKVKMMQAEPNRVWPREARLVLVDRVQDPGNLGTIIRTAAANAVDGVLLTTGSVDLYNDKVLRATMGALWQIPIETEVDPLECASRCRRQEMKIVASLLGARSYPHEVDLAGGVMVIVGNEGTGISEELRSIADLKVKIPMLGTTESLNVAVALGILLYEGTRQKLQIGVH